MSEQHYGRAPCGCERFGPDNPSVYLNGRKCYAINCSEHYQSAPWAAAEALEAGLRAIAGWPASEPPCVEVAGKGGRVVRVYADPYVMGPYLVNRIESSGTERPEPKHEYVHRESEFQQKIVGKPEWQPRKCYFCAALCKPVGVCSRCGNEQPPGEG